MTVTHDAPARDFSRYLTARLLSVAGTLVSVVALPVLVYRLTGSAGWTSAVAMAEALPYLVFGLLAGAVADRVDRRRLMVAMDVVVACGLVTVPLAWWAGVLTALHVVLVAFLAQTAFVFFDAANFGALPSLVGKDKLTAAYARLFGRSTVVELVVPAVAGLLVATAAPADLLAVNAVTAAGSAMLIRSIHGALSTPRADATTLVGDIGSGLRFLWRQPIVRTLTLVGATHSAAAGAWVAMLVPWADGVLGVAPSGDARLAALFSCWGVGALLASRLLPALTGRWGGARLALGALPVCLLCGVGALLSTHWVLACAAAIAWGAAHSTVVLNAITYRQRICPQELQSRVNTTARMLSWGLGQPAGAALAGAAAVLAGPRAGLAAGVAVLLAGVVLAWATPTLRRAARSATAD
ncbi:MFS transporter [Saccharothrix australiensis]|uniref:Transmembrane secretion effector n=1 Tax=Saccharothrix australiensis TaxID=2072 RepID=A0A495W5B4_9PSEU|nr:MFS transporter [Saccharothrix australiensis]RKT55853.1 transmembrane secretion effector [Saccharothrix australiensis]